MATKNMAYDHPAYLTPYVLGGRLSGASAAYKFAAFTAMVVKSFTIGVQTAGTSATDVVTAFKISGTATTTHALATFAGTAVGSTNVLGTFTLAQGDVLTIAHGTDATVDYGATAECVVVPGSNITL